MMSFVSTFVLKMVTGLKLKKKFRNILIAQGKISSLSLCFKLLVKSKIYALGIYPPEMIK